MGYYRFGYGPESVVTDAAGNVVAGRALTVWDAAVAGGQVTDLRDTADAPLSVLETDADGRFRFQAPDTTQLYWIDDGQNPRWSVGAAEAYANIGTALAQATDAQATADAAVATAEQVRGDQSTAGQVVVTASQFGAVGDGVADDTAAIQAAIDALPPAGGTVVFPTGTYLLSAAITVRSELRLVGEGDAASVLYQPNANVNGLVGTDIDRLTVENLKLFGPQTGSGVGILLLRDLHAATTYCTFRNLYVASWGSDGINISNPIVSTFSRVVSETNGGHGFHLQGVSAGAAGTSCGLTACYGNGNMQAGFRLFNMVYCALAGCAADSNGIGYLIDSCQGVTLVSCGCESGVNRSTNYPGTGFKFVGGFGNGSYGCWVFNNPEVCLYVTGGAVTTTVAGFTDNTPVAGAVNCLKVDAGCGIVMWSVSNTSPNSIATNTAQMLDDGGGGMNLRSYLYGASTASFEQDITSFGGNLITSLAGRGLKVKEGTAAKMGTVTLNGTTSVVVSNASVTATSRIFLTINTKGGVTPGVPYVVSRVAGTSFTVASTVASDNSVVAYLIVEPS